MDNVRYDRSEMLSMKKRLADMDVVELYWRSYLYRPVLHRALITSCVRIACARARLQLRWAAIRVARRPQRREVFGLKVRIQFMQPWRRRFRQQLHQAEHL